MFDALHKWLGIPPNEQPPNHYRLLGVANYESDLDVIDAAADRQLSFLHELTRSEHAELAAQISNRVSLARLCLLHPNKKAAYDESLKQGLLAKASSHSVDSSSSDSKESEGTPGSPIVSTASVQVRSRSRTSRKPAQSSLLWRLSSVVGVMALLTLVIALLRGDLVLDFSRIPGLSSVLKLDSTQADLVPVSAIHQSNQEKPKVLKSPPKNRQRTNDLTQRNVASRPPTQSPSGHKNRNSAVGRTRPQVKRRSLGDLLHRQPEDLLSGNRVSRSPLPTAPEIVAKKERIRELYVDEYRKAKNSVERIDLAKTIFRDAKATKDDLVGRIAAWQLAVDIFVKDGKFSDALSVVITIAEHYDGFDKMSEQLRTIRKCSRYNYSPRDRVRFIDTIISCAKEAQRSERFHLAVDAVDLGLKTYRGKLISTQKNDLLAIRDKSLVDAAQYDEFRRAIEDLGSEPENSPRYRKLSKIIGRYLAVYRGDWGEASYYFSSCDDPLIVKAGELGIRGGQNASSRYELAEAWLEVSESIEDSVFRTAVQQRARSHYQASKKHVEGLKSRSAEKQLLHLNEILGDEEPGVQILGHRIWTSKDSRTDSAGRKGNKIYVKMGSREDGRGGAAVGLELVNISKLSIHGKASHEEMEMIGPNSKVGFLIDYHTAAGYIKRVFLGLGTQPILHFDPIPNWGTASIPTVITNIGKSNQYDIDLMRWAPSGWDRRCWVTLLMQDSGKGRSIEAVVQW